MPRKITAKDIVPVLPRIFAKEWRTRIKPKPSIDKVVVELEKLGIPCSKATISRIENGKQAYTQDILIGLALVYGCTTLQIQYVNPRDPNSIRAVLAELLMPIT